MSISSTKKMARTGSSSPGRRSGMTFSKLEDVIQEVPSLSSNELSSAVEEVCQKLLVPVKSVGQIYDVPLKEPSSAVQQTSEEAKEGIIAATCNSPLNTRRIEMSASSEYGQPPIMSMIVIVNVLYVVMSMLALSMYFVTCGSSIPATSC